MANGTTTRSKASKKAKSGKGLTVLTVKVGGSAHAVIVHDAEEGGFWAEVQGISGCVSQGETLAELKANIADAIGCVSEAKSC